MLQQLKHGRQPDAIRDLDGYAGTLGGGAEPGGGAVPGAAGGAPPAGRLSVTGPAEVLGCSCSSRSSIEVDVRPSAATSSLKSCRLEATRSASSIETRPAW